MLIDQEKCIGCKICVPYCPVQAISLNKDGKAAINLEACLECGNCIRERTVPCPPRAIYEDKGIYDTSRVIRRILSDPTTTHKVTKVPGRGTEEVKTNDVTGRVCRGEIGVAVEMGRPCLGTSMKDVEKVTTALSVLDIRYEEANPVTLIMEDRATGTFDNYYSNERVISAIIEFTTEINNLEKVIAVLSEVAPQINTVFSLDIICCFNEDGSLPVLPILDKLGIEVRVNSKVNLGLGVPYIIERQAGRCSK